MDSRVDTISTRGQAKGSFIKHPIQKRYITQEDEDQECADLLDMDIENKLHHHFHRMDGRAWSIV
jgi:hypothetical protein